MATGGGEKESGGPALCGSLGEDRGSRWGGRRPLVPWGGVTARVSHPFTHGAGRGFHMTAVRSWDLEWREVGPFGHQVAHHSSGS